MATESKTQRLEAELKRARKPRHKIGLMNDLAMELHYSDPGEAIQLASTALALASEINFPLGIARSYFSIGMALFKRAEYVDAILAFQSAIEGFQKAQDRWGESNVLNNLGLIYQRIGDYSKALQFFSDATKIKEQAHDQYGKANVLISMAGIYRAAGKLEEAKTIIEEVLQISKTINADALVSKGLVEYGLILFEEQHFREAEEIFTEALHSFDKQDRTSGTAQCLIQLGKIKMEVQDLSQAILLLKEARALAEKIGDRNSAMMIHYELASIGRQSGNHDEAVSNLLTAQEIAEQLGEKPLLSKIHQLLSEMYEADKKFDLALLHLQRSNVLTEEITIDEATTHLQNLEISRRVEVLEQEKKLFEMEKQLALEHVRKRISGDLHDDIGATLSGFSIYSDVIKRELQNGHLDEVAKSIESIGEESRELLERLSDIVWAINPRNDQFEKITQRLRNYSMRMCEGKNIVLDFQTDPGLGNIILPLETRNNFYLILKEAINNAAKYSCCTQLQVDIRNSSLVTAVVKDNGKGFEPSGNSEGNGLKNMQQRAAEIKARFDLQSQTGYGTTVVLEILP